jgi:excisionase family DNA binding protein
MPMVSLMTASDVAQCLQVKPRTIYEWAERGMIPCVKLGRLIRFRPEDVGGMIESRLIRAEATQ